METYIRERAGKRLEKRSAGPVSLLFVSFKRSMRNEVPRR